MNKVLQERMVKVRLYGKLRKFGKEFELSVRSTREAIHALCVMIPGFKAYLQNADKLGVEFAIFNGKRNISADELELGAKDVIKIAPVYGGRKRGGVFQTIIGAILIVVGAVLIATGVGGPAGAFLVKLGAAMVIGGVVQMLSPTAKGLSDSSDTENRSSYAFGSPVNTTAQGNPVPVYYGLREVGGACISAGMYSTDVTT